MSLWVAENGSLILKDIREHMRRALVSKAVKAESVPLEDEDDLLKSGRGSSLR